MEVLEFTGEDILYFIKIMLLNCSRMQRQKRLRNIQTWKDDTHI